MSIHDWYGLSAAPIGARPIGNLQQRMAPSPLASLFNQTATVAEPTEDMVRRVVREELERLHGTHLVPAGADLRRLYRSLTGKEMP